MNVTQILKGLDKDIQSALKPFFAVPTQYKIYYETKGEPRLAYKRILIRKAWQLQEQRDKFRDAQAAA